MRSFLTQVYGWAGYVEAPEGANGTEQSGGFRAVLTLRNPSNSYQSISLEPTKVFELPVALPNKLGRGGALRVGTLLQLGSPFSDQGIGALDLTRSAALDLELAPFEVLVFDSAATRFGAPGARKDGPSAGERWLRKVWNTLYYRIQAEPVHLFWLAVGLIAIGKCSGGGSVLRSLGTGSVVSGPSAGTSGGTGNAQDVAEIRRRRLEALEKRGEDG